MDQLSIGLDDWAIGVIRKMSEEKNTTMSEVAREILVTNLLEFKK